MKKTTEEKKAANEVWVTGTTSFGSYLAYIARLFDENYDQIVIKAMGYAITRALDLGMLLRRKFKGIHQIAEVRMESLKGQDGNREVGQVVITVSKKELDRNHVGYTGPLPDAEVQEYQPFVATEARNEQPPIPRGRGRGGYRARAEGHRNNYGWNSYEYGRARGGAQGRFGRGRGGFVPRRFRSYY
eukprot:TRINITY_DN1601_c0_g1_i12.p3 TRINITY_DN1601_c0_g1~~TRINITY_DN1601_c0_g1_i12.p3  ORF type:complete len:187 (+),score=45.09 TRINITY_DN1601_c0_g1_i12:149-709(+)